MDFNLPNVSPLVTYGLAGLVVAIVVRSKLMQKSPLDTLPTAGADGFFGLLSGSLNFMTNASGIIREGCKQHKGKPFKVAMLFRWMVIVSGQKLTDEVRKAPDDELSFSEAMNDAIKTEYTLGHEIHNNPYHIPIIRSQLTRNLAVLFPEIRDEIVAAFEETLNLKGNEWSAVPAADAVMQVICRASNRIFVGLPLCRDPDWKALNIQFAKDVIVGSTVLKLFPRFLSPFVLKYMTGIPSINKFAMKRLQVIIEERQRYLDEYGTEWADKPNDMLSWLMDEAVGEERSVRNLTQRILMVNFGSIHSSSNTFTQALFNLAANPQYVQPLREEVEAIVEKEGWSKDAIAKMRKVDSFLKETLRFGGLGCLGVGRKALKDVTLSDGTVIPKGTIVAIALHATHRNEAVYANADVFEPFRFADLREEEGEGVKYQMVSTSLEYLPFGHGIHACPGRFFAANELKAMLAHVILVYDVKFERDSPKPPILEFASTFSVDTKVKVMFRRRQD